MRKVSGNMAAVAAVLAVMVAMPAFADDVVQPSKILRPTASGVTPPMSEYVAPEPAIPWYVTWYVHYNVVGTRQWRVPTTFVVI